MEVLGSIPFLPQGRPSVSDQARLVAAFRDARLAIRPLFEVGEVIAFEVVSATPRAGVTFVSSNLALQFAEAGYRVLLVDAGTTQRAAAALLGTGGTPSLGDYLDYRAELNDVLKETAYARLFVAPLGRASMAVVNDVGPRRHELPTDLTARFDVVIVDRTVPDTCAAIVVPSVLYGSCVLVTDSDAPRDLAAPQELGSSGGRTMGRILGVVRNGVR